MNAMPYPLAETHLGSVARGMTLPQLFMVNGIGKCLIKFQQNPQGDRVLINEWIGMRLAQLLGIDCPAFGIAQVDEFAIPKDGLSVSSSLYPDDRFVFQAGLHFYSKFLEPITDLHFAQDASMLGIAANPQVIAGIVLLDLWLGNKDRSPRNPNLILHREGNRQKVKLIDMSSAFGSAIWTIGSLINPMLPPPEAPLPYAYMPERLLETVQPLTDFAPYLAKLTALRQTDLEPILQEIPPEWHLTSAESAALLNYLEIKRLALPEYLAIRLGNTQKKWYL
jgi:hypothetical protein